MITLIVYIFSIKLYRDDIINDMLPLKLDHHSFIFSCIYHIGVADNNTIINLKSFTSNDIRRPDLLKKNPAHLEFDWRTPGESSLIYKVFPVLNDYEISLHVFIWSFEAKYLRPWSFVFRPHSSHGFLTSSGPEPAVSILLLFPSTSLTRLTLMYFIYIFHSLSVIYFCLSKQYSFLDVLVYIFDSKSFSFLFDDNDAYDG